MKTISHLVFCDKPCIIDKKKRFSSIFCNVHKVEAKKKLSVHVQFGYLSDEFEECSPSSRFQSISPHISGNGTRSPRRKSKSPQPLDNRFLLHSSESAELNISANLFKDTHSHNYFMDLRVVFVKV